MIKKRCDQQKISIFDIALEAKGLKSLCDRRDIKKKFLFRYVKKQKYAPLIIQRYLLLLIHFYDFVICEDINRWSFTRSKTSNKGYFLKLSLIYSFL